MNLNIAYDVTLVQTYQKTWNQVAFPLDTFHAPKQCLVLYFENKLMQVKIQAVTGSWGEASLYALQTGVSSGTSPFHNMVVALAVNV
jgi:hypothetical protein